MIPSSRGSNELSRSVTQIQKTSPVPYSTLPSYKEYLPPFRHKKLDPSSVIPPSQADFLQCSICFEVFDHPVTLSCGHTFCLNCLKDSRNTTKTCFKCRSPLPSLENPRKNFDLANMVDNLLVPCPSHKHDTEKTCQEKVKVKDLEQHWKSCPHIKFQCKCKELIISPAFLETDTICKCPDVKCEYCSGLFQERLIKFHSDDCMRNGIKCKLCGSKVASLESHHRSNCLSYCPYKDYGCDEQNKMTQEELKAHCQRYNVFHEFWHLQSKNADIAESFFREKIKLNEKIPDSHEEKIMVFLATDNTTDCCTCLTSLTVGDLISDIASNNRWNLSGQSVELRFIDTDKNGFLSKDKKIRDYNIKFGQTLEVCLVKTSGNDTEA